MIGTLVEQHILACVEDGSRVLEAADNLFQFHLQEVAFGCEERIVARVVGDSPLETMYRVVTEGFVELWSRVRIGRRYVWVADFDVFATIGDTGRQIVFDPLVAERHAAADALFIPVDIP